MTLVKVNNRPALKTWNGLVNELFNDLEKNLPVRSHVTSTRQWPAVNIIETAEGYHAEILAPGRKKELFKIEVENGQLILSYDSPEAERPADWKQIRNEFSIGNFKRVFNLDETVNTEAIQAKYEEGLLKVFLPKKPELKPATRQIEIQ